MNFNLCRHGRLAGCVAILVGLWLNHWVLMLVGNLIIALFYMWSINKIEGYLEEQRGKDAFCCKKSQD